MNCPADAPATVLQAYRQAGQEKQKLDPVVGFDDEQTSVTRRSLSRRNNARGKSRRNHKTRSSNWPVDRNHSSQWYACAMRQARATSLIAVVVFPTPPF